LDRAAGRKISAYPFRPAQFCLARQSRGRIAPTKVAVIETLLEPP